MGKKILVIGIHEGYADLFRRDQDLDLYVLDEPGLYARNRPPYDSYGITELRLGEYQQTDRFLEPAVSWHEQVGFDAVVPCWEYSVAAAGLLASELGLEYSGMRAVQACTDKVRLRRAAAEIGIRQPRFSPVTTARDVEEFFDGRPIVVKPTNRRQSVGVVRVDRAGEIAAAWDACMGSGEPPGLADRELTSGLRQSR